ncbi:serine/threonine-protein kinase [Sinomonas atrocyanea]|uniref:serine/threonine protein kinase n=1 Tax=Sinomonas atrocyanea TaxID=37927 RepID=UPI0028675D98|nr:serine/threonine-protein kinase [Sinomonas atrocyanea]MDR6620359.1 serine/threonine-protein kinase [Sinomonas atrocyanea]
MKQPDLLDLACERLSLTVVSDLKAGGQKTVHLVQRDERQQVLKLVKVGSADPTVLQRAHREVELLAATHHPNVVEVASELEELGEPISGAAWLEEYLDGDDLSAYLDAPWAPTEVLRMGRDVAAGLGALHAQKVVHRDLSANNVRRLSDGTYKVMDPGFAKHTLRSGLTVGGQPGTPGFMTPEHLQAYSGPTPASDVYAVGQLMYAAATGQLPVPWLGDDADYISRLAQGRIRSIDELRSGFPRDLSTIIERALHQHPARRYRNGERLREALDGLT